MNDNLLIIYPYHVRKAGFRFSKCEECFLMYNFKCNICTYVHTIWTVGEKYSTVILRAQS